MSIRTGWDVDELEFLRLLKEDPYDAYLYAYREGQYAAEREAEEEHCYTPC